MRTEAIVYVDRADLSGDFTDVMLLDEAVDAAKAMAARGCECFVFKLVQTHYFAPEESNADAK